MAKYLSLMLAMTCLACASCRVKVVEDSSAFALDAGQATMLLGSSCSRPMALGYDSCQLTEDQKIPNLHLYFMNAAEYAVSDCELGIHKTGSIDTPGEAVIDLSGLQNQLNHYKFCLLRIEAIERYPDPRDKNQKREIPFAGGFFLEVLDKDYFPTPSKETVSWCFVVKGTNKGRRSVEPCP